MSAQEAAEVISSFASNSMVSWLVTVGCAVVVLLFAARQCNKALRKR